MGKIEKFDDLRESINTLEALEQKLAPLLKKVELLASDRDRLKAKIIATLGQQNSASSIFEKQQC